MSWRRAAEPSPVSSAGSVTGRLLSALFGPLVAIALTLGLGGALLIHQSVESVNDRLLQASARAIADTLAAERGQVSLDLPQAAFGMLENAQRDNVYYSVTAGRSLVTGYADLPAAREVNLAGTLLRYDTFRGRRVRIATEARRLPRVEGVVTVQVAETLESRRALVTRLLLALVFLEASILALIAAMAPTAVRWGLRPLRRLEAEMNERSGEGAFRPLPLEATPLELRGLIGAFNALLGRLDHAADAVRRFSADASHQLRTPLAVMRTNIGLLSVRITDPAARQPLSDLDGSAARLQRLLEQLLALSRAENLQNIAVETVNVVELARRVALEQAPRAVAAGQDLHFIAGTKALSALSNQVLLREILSNLIDNAICHAGGGALITVAVERVGGQVIVTVSDDGVGVDPALRPRLGDRFVRSTKDDSSGSGLGLSIVGRLAAALGAELAFSFPAHGLTVALRLGGSAAPPAPPPAG